MSQTELVKKYEALPTEFQKEIDNFVDYMESKFKRDTHIENEIPKKRILGIGKGKGWISPDFDDPLDEMKEYME